MRQTELFPYLIDQEALDNYKWYQDTLEQFKVNKKVCLDTKASFKKHHKFSDFWNRRRFFPRYLSVRNWNVEGSCT